MNNNHSRTNHQTSHDMSDGTGTLREIIQTATKSIISLYDLSKEEEKEALHQLIVKDLNNLFTATDIPHNLQEHFIQPADTSVPAELSTLDSWIKQRCHANEFSEESFQPLLHIARYMDSQAGNNKPLIAFLPDWFLIDKKERIIPQAPRLDLAKVQVTQPMISNIQRILFQNHIHPDLLRSLKECDYHRAIYYSFGKYLAACFADITVSSMHELLDMIAKCRVKKPELPPELPVILEEVIRSKPNQPSQESCADLSQRILEAFRDNPFSCKRNLDRNTFHQCFGYSVPGLYKKNNRNEDQYATSVHDNLIFMLVADGVSTADLGTGKRAAETVFQQLFNSHIQEQLRALSSELKQNNNKEPLEAYCDRVNKLLKEFILCCHRSVTDELNKILISYPGIEQTGDIINPMCSTVTAAAIFHDQAIIRYLGDSPAWLFRKSKSDCIRLTVDHNKAMTSRAVPGQTYDSSLTRIIGSGYSENGKFLPSRDIGDCLHVQLEDGDILLLTTDGAIDCMNKGNYRNETFFAEQVCTLASEKDDPGLKLMIRKLVQLGEEGSSHDNITINGLLLEKTKSRS